MTRAWRVAALCCASAVCAGCAGLLGGHEVNVRDGEHTWYAGTYVRAQVLPPAGGQLYLTHQLSDSASPWRAGIGPELAWTPLGDVRQWQPTARFGLSYTWGEREPLDVAASMCAGLHNTTEGFVCTHYIFGERLWRTEVGVGVFLPALRDPAALRGGL